MFCILDFGLGLFSDQSGEVLTQMISVSTQICRSCWTKLHSGDILLKRDKQWININLYWGCSCAIWRPVQCLWVSLYWVVSNLLLQFIHSFVQVFRQQLNFHLSIFMQILKYQIWVAVWELHISAKHPQYAKKFGTFAWGRKAFCRYVLEMHLTTLYIIQ